MRMKSGAGVMFEWERWASSGRRRTRVYVDQPSHHTFRLWEALRRGGVTRNAGAMHEQTPEEAWVAAAKMFDCGEQSEAVIATLREGPDAYERWIFLHVLEEA